MEVEEDDLDYEDEAFEDSQEQEDYDDEDWQDSQEVTASSEDFSQSQSQGRAQVHMGKNRLGKNRLAKFI
ncbi:MAG: hypothetical protein GY823_09215 [Flavobacteriaceae bacterium]|nr:hypothetical protein [Flavobacteriaceae bacterium]